MLQISSVPINPANDITLTRLKGFSMFAGTRLKIFAKAQKMHKMPVTSM
jgi:hypothetical protein